MTTLMWISRRTTTHAFTTVTTPFLSSRHDHRIGSTSPLLQRFQSSSSSSSSSSETGVERTEAELQAIQAEREARK